MRVRNLFNEPGTTVEKLGNTGSKTHIIGGTSSRYLASSDEPWRNMIWYHYDYQFAGIHTRPVSFPL